MKDSVRNARIPSDTNASACRFLLFRNFFKNKTEYCHVVAILPWKYLTLSCVFNHVKYVLQFRGTRFFW